MHVGSLLPIWGNFVCWHVHLQETVSRLPTWNLKANPHNLLFARNSISKNLTCCKISWFLFLNILNYIQISIAYSLKRHSHTPSWEISVRREIACGQNSPCADGIGCVSESCFTSFTTAKHVCDLPIFEPSSNEPILSNQSFYHSVHCYKSHRSFFHVIRIICCIAE